MNTIESLRTKVERLIDDVDKLDKRSEVSAITVKVDRLISDVDGHDRKLEKISDQISWVRGAIAVATVVLGLLGWIFEQALDGKLHALADAVAQLHK